MSAHSQKVLVMSKKKKTAQDYLQSAENSLELANVLGGKGKISDQDFLELMAKSDEMVDHDGKTCGMCHQMIIGAQVAREMIEAGEYEEVVSKWAEEARKRWQKSKFFKLWQKEQKAGRDPHKAFEARGWEP